MSGTNGIGIGSTNYYTAQSQAHTLNSTNSASATDDANQANCSPSTDSSNNATDVSISPLGQLLSDLQQLKQKDPEKFKEVLSQLADELKNGAEQQQQTQDPKAAFLAKLSEQFQKVSESGDLSQLQIGQHHHGHHHHAGGSPSSAPASSVPGQSQSGAESLDDLFSTLDQEVTTALGE